MKAKDIMTATVISVPQSATVSDATGLMAAHHVSALPVTDADLVYPRISSGPTYPMVQLENALISADSSSIKDKAVWRES